MTNKAPLIIKICRFMQREKENHEDDQLNSLTSVLQLSLNLFTTFP